MKRLLFIFIAFFMLIIIGTASLLVAFNYLDSAPDTSRTANYTVSKGITLRKAANDLESEGLIRNADFFVLLSYLSDNKSVLSGSYTIHTDSTASKIYKKLSSGSIDTVSVTIPEGFNIYQIGPALEAAGICSEEKFLYYVHDRDFLLSLGIQAQSAEGYLFPDTYSFAPQSDARDVISYMKKKMDAVLGELNYKEHIPPGMTLHQMLIIASLVEKEAQIKSEQRRVASVFLNRVERNMRFDSDPTVRYAVKKFTGRIRYRDLESDSPYNTYRVWGYPPTPIASPGKGAIAAVLNPEDSNYLYFVARNDGSHYFSKNLSRHNAAVNYYQKGQRNGFHDEQR